MKNKLAKKLPAILCVCTLSHAEGLPDLSINPKPYGSLSAGMEYYSYKEPGVMSVSGPMVTLRAFGGVKLNPLFKTDFEAYGAFDAGKNVYDGSVVYTLPDNSKKTVPAKNRSSDYYVGGVWRNGLVLGDGKNEWLVLYLGLGYRFLDNYVLGEGAYARRQAYLYLPFGASTRILLTTRISLSLNAELRALLLGKNKSAFSQIGYDNDLYFTQHNGTGAKISVAAEFFLTRQTAMFVRAGWDYWSIGDSTLAPAYKNGKFQGNFREPKNTTATYGIEIGYLF